MPAKSGRDRKKGGGGRLQRFWREWRVGAILALLIAGAVALYQLVLRPARQRVLEQAAPYRIYFTQGDAGTAAPQGLEAEIVADVAAARESVDVATPGLDLPELTAGLIAAQGRGVLVRVLQDGAAQSGAAVATATTRLQDAGVPVVFHPPDGALGESFLVVDQRLVWAGSCTLSQAGLQQDSSFILRWQLPPLAKAFHGEFIEMFEGGSFGPASPAEPLTYHAIPDHGRVWVYFTPEADPLAEILQTLTKAQSMIVAFSEKLNDQRLGDRLVGESRRPGIGLWAIVDPQGGSSTSILEELGKKAVQVTTYRGSGRLRENVIVIDGQLLFLFSQPMDQQGLDHNDGFVLVVQDEALGNAFAKEFARLFGRPPGEP